MKHTGVNKDVDKWGIREILGVNYTHEFDKGTVKIVRKPQVEAHKSQKSTLGVKLVHSFVDNSWITIWSEASGFARVLLPNHCSSKGAHWQPRNQKRPGVFQAE